MGATLESLHGLTVGQAKAIQAYVENGGNGAQAYQTAYPNASYNTAKNNFSDLLDKPNVQEAIRRACERLNLTPETHLQKLAELRDQAANAQQFSSAVKGEELRGRVAGYYVDKREELNQSEHTVRFVFEQRKTTAG